MLHTSIDPSSSEFLCASTNQVHKSVSLQDISSVQQDSSALKKSPSSSTILVALSSCSDAPTSSRLCYSQEGLNSTLNDFSTPARRRARSAYIDETTFLSTAEKKGINKSHPVRSRIPSRKKTKDINFPLHNPKSPEVLVEFLKEGQDPNIPNPEGLCPVHMYISRQHKKKYLELLYTLLTHSNANINIRNSEGATPIHMAIKERNLHIVKLLLAFGADINPLDSQSLTPLDHALKQNFESAISLLLSVGALNREATFEPDLPRLMSFHDSLKIKEQLKKLRMKSLCARRHVSHYYSNGQIADAGCYGRNEDREASAVNGGLREDCCRSGEDDMSRAGEVLDTPDAGSREDGFVGVRDRLFSNQCLERATLADMESGTTLQTLSQRLERFINLKLDLSGSFTLNVDEAVAITMQQAELVKHNKTQPVQNPYSFNINGGSRILFLDGGGMRGLLQIEILEQLEKKTGRRVTELFDWIVGTSTGAIVALSLVYAKRSLAQLRQLYFKMKDKVFKNDRLGFAYNTEALENILQEEFGEVKMNDVEFPKVIITAVYKKTTMPELHFFNNCFHDEFSTQLVWKVARYTSAAPMFFRECDDYVDGGVLANNPCSYGLSAIQNFHRQLGKKLDIALVVSVGSGIFPAQDLGKTDAQEFLYFGRHWLKAGHSIKARAKSLITLLTTALVESESVARSFNSRLQEQGVPFYRFNPQLEEVIPSGETDLTRLLNMVTTTKMYMLTLIQGQTMLLLEELVQLFHMVADIHRRELPQASNA